MIKTSRAIYAAITMVMVVAVGLTGCASHLHDVEEVRSLVLETNSLDGSTYVEADLTKQTLTYAEPEGSSTGPKQTCRLTEEQIEHLLGVLAQRYVLNWNAEYPDHSEYEDGMTWFLTIHTPDEIHESRGENIQPAPEGFTDVRDELQQLAEAPHCLADK